jgi:hypothetical protein
MKIFRGHIKLKSIAIYVNFAKHCAPTMFSYAKLDSIDWWWWIWRFSLKSINFRFDQCMAHNFEAHMDFGDSQSLTTFSTLRFFFSYSIFFSFIDSSLQAVTCDEFFHFFGMGIFARWLQIWLYPQWGGFDELFSIFLNF